MESCLFGKIVLLNKRESNGKTVAQNFENARESIQKKIESAERAQQAKNEISAQKRAPQATSSEQEQPSSKLPPQRSAQFRKDNKTNLSMHKKSIPAYKGKTYVFSDVHGMYGSYIEAMSKMTPNDTVIILGDVIDRGRGGIKILQDIIRRQKDRKHNPEIIFMMGNHEMQFLIAMGAIERQKLDTPDILNICEYWKRQYKLLQGYLIEPYKSQFVNEKIKYQDKYRTLVEKGLTEDEAQWIYIWLWENGGTKTFNTFIVGGENIKDVEEQDKIIDFLKESYVIMPRIINNKDYLFVHAMPPNDTKVLETIKKQRRMLTFNELYYSGNSRDRSLCESILQERDHETYQSATQAGFFKTICGHTPEFYGIRKTQDYIRIDTGCGNNNKLALYCVDDDTVQYIDAKEQETPGNSEWQQ